MKDRIFYIICFGFLFGIFLRSFFEINIFLSLFLFLIFLIIFLYFSLLSKNENLKRKNLFALIFTFFLAFSFGIWRFHLSEKVPDLPINTAMEFSGKIIDSPERKEKNQKITVLLDKEKPKTKVLLTTNLSEYYHYGDTIKFSGLLKKPDNFNTEQGKEFDYLNYLRKDKIFFLSNYPKIEILDHGKGNFLKRNLLSVKEKFLEKIEIKIPKPEISLLAGLILGERSDFSQDLRQNFINTGTIHIVALSGYNVTIVAEWIMKLFMFLPLSLSIGIGIFAIFLFVLMTGVKATAIRAGIMASLALIARATGRNYDVLRALILAGVVMVLINPLLLVYDVSFQLSFLATIAVIFLTPRIEKYFVWVPKKFKLRDIISVTCAAYLFVLPFVLYKMGNLSLVALPANVLVLPFIPITMLFGFLTGFAGFIGFPLSVPFAFISKILLTYELGIINYLAQLPFASFAIPNFPLFITLVIYAYFLYFLFGREIKKFFILQS